MLFIYSMYSLLFVVLLGHLTSTDAVAQVKFNNRRLLAVIDIVPPLKNAKVESQGPKVEQKELVVKVASNNNNVDKNNQPAGGNITANKSSTVAPLKSSTSKHTDDTLNHYNKPIEMESGAFLRGVLVVVSLTIILIIYIGVKTYYGYL